jgi:DNA-binding transcriptional LysR family regulator
MATSPSSSKSQRLQRRLAAAGLAALHSLRSPQAIARHGEPKAMCDLQAHQCLRLSGAEYQPGAGGSPAAAWGAILPNTMGTDAGTVLMEACASGAGIAALPSYVSEFDDRLTPLIAHQAACQSSLLAHLHRACATWRRASPCCTGSGRALIRRGTPVSGKSMYRPNAKTMIGRH